MSTSARSSPTNILWPSKRTWELFDLLLGGALVKTVPLAASCYSAWSEYDAAEFEVVPLIGPTRTCMLPTPRQLWGHCTRAEPVCLPTTPLATHRWWLHDDDRLVALPPRGGRTPLSSTPPSKPSSPPSRPIRLDCSMQKTVHCSSSDIHLHITSHPTLSGITKLDQPSGSSVGSIHEPPHLHHRHQTISFSQVKSSVNLRSTALTPSVTAKRIRTAHSFSRVETTKTNRAATASIFIILSGIVTRSD